MAKRALKIQQALALALALALVAPVAAYASDGKKHFKEGLKYEENQQWDKAAEKFALAVADKPSNVEYQLHLHRSLVNAGLMLVDRGDMLADKKDFNAAYHAYRQAYSFDPTNELALIKMRRMLEAQGLPTDGLPSIGDPAGPKGKPSQNLKTSLTPTVTISAVPGGSVRVQMPAVPSRRYPKTDVIARADSLLSYIEQLAQDMGLNVIFDMQVANQMRAARLTIDLRDVTKPRALEMILQTNNLMYSQLDTRTIVIASDNPQSRLKYEPLAVRTFYIKNADINEVRGVITSTLASKQVVPVKQLNALVVRDTPANLELIDSMINSLDKSKAEVLIDVKIYEVSRNDLLQIGNQFNATGQSDKGIVLPGFNNLGGIGADIAGGTRMLTGPFGIGLGLPSSALSIFQNRGKSKLLASTQIHVLDAEANTVRIGQRVPIQTASLPTFNTPSPRDQRRAAEQTGVQPSELFQGVGGFGGIGIPQIQYENVGLNIDVTPNVYEDDVQMKMKIESTSVDASTGKLTPTFNQRTMTSVARIKDGQTTLVAGVSQNIESKSVKGLPLIGLIPILGRFFATPETDNRQSDVVITITPHILRRADIREEDHLARLAGTSSDPSTQLTIEHILFLADQADVVPNQVAATGPEAPTAPAAGQPDARAAVNPAQRGDSPGVVVTLPPGTTSLTPVSTQPAARQGDAAKQPVKPEVVRKTVEAPGVPNQVLDDDDDDDDDEAVDPGPVTVSIRSAMATITKGQDLYTVVVANGNAEISAAHVALGYDPNVLEVKGVREGSLLSSAGSVKTDLQFSADSGVLSVEVTRPTGTGGVAARGQLLIIIFGVKNPGQSPLTLVEGRTFFRTPNGQVVPLRLQSTQVEAK
ncbi:MAG TPA: secretin N-terminal domain-containing protein [Blastocatellia bacterium]|nr:secretin N-terminal domain-containing protein [Blastocatellia bacterium]